MFPEQNGVRPVTLQGDLVSVTERRVNGPRCHEHVWTGPPAVRTTPAPSLRPRGEATRLPERARQPAQAAAGLGLGFR